MKKEFTSVGGDFSGSSISLGIFVGMVITLFAIGIMASKPAPVKESSYTPAPSSSLIFVTSRDGISIYRIGDCYVAKTDDGVSIAK